MQPSPPKRTKLSLPPRLVGTVSGVDAFSHLVRVVTGGVIQHVFLRQASPDRLEMVTTTSHPVDVWTRTRVPCSFGTGSASLARVGALSALFAEAVAELTHGEEGGLRLATTIAGDKLQMERALTGVAGGAAPHREIILPLVDIEHLSEVVGEDVFARPTRHVECELQIEALQKFLSSAHRNRAEEVSLRLETHTARAEEAAAAGAVESDEGVVRVYRTLLEFRGGDNGVFSREKYTTAVRKVGGEWRECEVPPSLPDAQFRVRYRYRVRTKWLLPLVSRMTKSQSLRVILSSSPVMHLYYEIPESGLVTHIVMNTLCDDEDDVRE